ncbi:hypothetical protein BD311DRAFT_62688 [Dichomitus squalens]|uniref:Secreted protein n=1 Tax=Dichomitus squalens TaxID=114155 RepID=A0A4Q9M9S5_9APHY|nr:hypothetical protein BD311DRAFT_62688 [Dichomitus squalens]
MVPLLLFYLLCGVTWKLQMSVYGRAICRLKLQGQRRLGGVSACRRTSSISRLPSSYVSVLRLPRRNCHRNRIPRRCSDVGEVRYCVPSLKIPARVSSMDRVRGRLPWSTVPSLNEDTSHWLRLVAGLPSSPAHRKGEQYVYKRSAWRPTLADDELPAS